MPRYYSRGARRRRRSSFASDPKIPQPPRKRSSPLSGYGKRISARKRRYRGKAVARPWQGRIDEREIRSSYALLPKSFFDKIRELSNDFTFDKDPTGRTIIKLRGARFFGITPPMTDPEKRIEDMDRVGIDVEVVSLSTPNVFFAPAERQPEVARMVNDDYGELIARYPKRFQGFASIPMDDPEEAIKELHRALDELKLNGVILMSNIQGRSLTSPQYRAFFEEANRRKVCIFLHPMLPANPEPYRRFVLGPLVGFPSDTTLATAEMCFDGLFRELPDIR